MKKNTATTIMFYLYDTTGNPVTTTDGVSCSVSTGGTSAHAATNDLSAVSGVSGLFKLELTALEMSADTVAVQVSGETIASTDIIITPDETDYALETTVDSLQDTVATAAAVSSLSNIITLIHNKTTNLPNNPAAASNIPSAQTIANTILTTDLSDTLLASQSDSGIEPPAVFSLYTMIQGSLNSSVIVADGATTGVWQIQHPDGTNHTNRVITTDEQAKPITSIS